MVLPFLCVSCTSDSCECGWQIVVLGFNKHIFYSALDSLYLCYSHLNQSFQLLWLWNFIISGLMMKTVHIFFIWISWIFISAAWRACYRLTNHLKYTFRERLLYTFSNMKCFLSSIRRILNTLSVTLAVR